MKRLLQLFGLLDIITLVRSYKHIIPQTSSWTAFPEIVIANTLLYILLILSSYFLLRQNKVGLWLTYAQFPLRLAFLVLSFGFLLTLSRFFDDKEQAYRIIMWISIVLEICRLIFSIQIHRKYFLSSKTAVTP